MPTLSYKDDAEVKKQSITEIEDATCQLKKDIIPQFAAECKDNYWKGDVLIKISTIKGLTFDTLEE